MKIKNAAKGLVGLLGSAALAVGMSGEAKGDTIYVEFQNKSINNSYLEIDHTSGATEDFDNGYDSSFLAAPSPALDIYSKVSFDPFKLSTDARPPESFSTITAEIDGRELLGLNNNALVFSIYDFYGENIFANKNIFADLYNSSHTLLGTYDVKDLAATSTTIPITVNNGLSYTMDIRFENIPEPSTISLLAMAGIAGAGAGAYSLRRRKQNGQEDGPESAGTLRFSDYQRNTGTGTGTGLERMRRAA